MKHLLIALLLLVGLTGHSLAAISEEVDESFDRIKYESEAYENERKISYIGQMMLSISDYATLFEDYKDKDSEFLKLIIREKETSKSLSGLAHTRPRDDINLHFLTETKRIFNYLPFYDLNKGRAERFEKFRRDNPEFDWVKNSKAKIGEMGDAFRAAEISRANALYGGRAGTVYCDVRVKRRTFPVLYEIGCTVSGEEGFVPQWSESRDIGFSTAEYIDKEIKQAITRMLDKKSSELKKIKKYGKK